MNFAHIIDGFLTTYGRQYSIGTITSKCILSSKGGQNIDFLKEEIDRMGTKMNGKYIMFCSSTSELTVGSTVEIGGILYEITAVDSFFIGENVVYKYAVLDRGGSVNE